MEVHLLQGEDCLCLGPARDTHDASSGRCCWSMSLRRWCGRTCTVAVVASKGLRQRSSRGV